MIHTDFFSGEGYNYDEAMKELELEVNHTIRTVGIKHKDIITYQVEKKCDREKSYYKCEATLSYWKD